MNDEHMEVDDRMQISVTNDKYLYSFVILIDNISISDAGKITFIASNEKGQATAAVDFVVTRRMLQF